MLISLRLQNLAVIEEAEATFGTGLTVLTGETGAGKSIVIDAVALLLGGRAGAEVVRAGAEEAVVEGVFERTEVLQERLSELGLPDDGQEMHVRRTVGRQGRGRVHVNGALVTVGVLGRLMRGLIDLAGQHEHMTLLDSAQHLALLDRLGGLEAADSALDRYRGCYSALREVERQLELLGGDQSQVQARLEFLSFQLEELDRLAPRAGEDQELDAERRRLVSVERLRQLVGSSHELLSGGDAAALELVGRVLALLGEAEKIDPALGQARGALASAQAELDEAARALNRCLGSLEADPQRLAEVEERLDALRRLCRKYSANLEGVLARREQLTAEHQLLRSRGERRAALERERTDAMSALRVAAAELTSVRSQAADRLTAAVSLALSKLALPHARLRAVLVQRIAVPGPNVADKAVGPGGSMSPSEADQGPASAERSRFGPDGVDAVELLFSANRGEPERPFAKVASGGEASRVMLAVKASMAAADACRCYVLDEADAGVGGAVADVVGRLIKAISEHHQVLCITHLPQIAAHAETHLCIEKSDVGGRTRAVVTSLPPGEPRTRELARMLSGVVVSKEAVGAAKALLQSASTTSSPARKRNPRIRCRPEGVVAKRILARPATSA